MEQTQFQLHQNCNSESSMCQEYQFDLKLLSQLKIDKAFCFCNKNKEKLMVVHLHHLFLLNHFPGKTLLKTVLVLQLRHQLLIDEVWALIKYYQPDQITIQRRRTKQNIERLIERKTILNSRQTGVEYS